MGVWGYFQYPTEPPSDDLDNYYAEQESLDERAEQDDVAEDDDVDAREWGAWLDVGERPVPNTG